MIPQIKSILYTTGLGSGTPYVFRYALSIAQKYDAKIHIIHAHEPLTSSGQNMADLYMFQEKSADVFKQAVADAEKEIIQRLDILCTKETASDPQGRERIASIEVIKQPPKQAILAEAERLNADMIIMGSHRHSVLADAMLGTTTLKVLHRSTIPVMVIRIPEGYQEEGF